MNTVFQIADKKLTSLLDPIQENNQFVIRSVPRPYSVIWDEEPVPGKSIQKVLSENPNHLLFIDERVFELYGSEISHPESKILKAKATEEFKTFQGMLDVVDFMESHQITKGEKLVVVGGGIIQDVGAFGAAVFKRGIPWTFFPTTLLSQCDSCIGGKTGLNHKSAKNQMALFSAPSKVIINPNFLPTLTPHDLKSGLGEVFKLHITGGPEFLKSYFSHRPKDGILSNEAAKKLILSALSVKKAVIEEDEFELNLRRSMNYGHTLGHAIETLSQYRIPHGLAVVIGIILSNELSFRYQFLSRNERDFLQDLSFDLLEPEIVQIMKSLSIEGLFSLLKKDKKTTGNKVNFVILHSVGDMRFLPLTLDEHLIRELTQIIREVFE